jgi:NAD(P)-dependent dehydrogenase (short-subunit alcohol dehydrogenase family)
MIHTAIQGKFGLPPEVAAVAERTYSARMPLGRFGEATEVSGLALFLASDASSFVTGTEIPVDGGLVAT